MINQTRLIKTFLQIVQIDSPSGKESEFVNFLVGFIKNLHLPITTNIDNAGNVICKTNNCNNPILLTAHLDTVEPGQGIKPKIEDGVIKSDGTTILGADNKVGIAVILETLQSIYEKFEKLPDLEIVFTVSEEVGNLGAVNLDYSNLKSKIGYSFDGSDQVASITMASPFYTRFDIQINGQSVHAGKPEQGINPISVFLLAMQNIPLGRLSNGVLCNIGILQGGQARNSVPADITINGEVRSYNEVTLEQTLDNIYLQFDNACKKFNAKLNFEKVRENSGFEFKETDKDIHNLINLLKPININPELIKCLGCYDANIFFEHKIKVINLSNGSLFNHTTNEQISINNLVTTGKVCYQIVQNKLKSI